MIFLQFLTSGIGRFDLLLLQHRNIYLVTKYKYHWCRQKVILGQKSKYSQDSNKNFKLTNTNALNGNFFVRLERYSTNIKNANYSWKKPVSNTFTNQTLCIAILNVIVMIVWCCARFLPRNVAEDRDHEGGRSLGNAESEPLDPEKGFVLLELARR